MSDAEKTPPKDVNPELRREVTRRGLLTREFRKATTEVVRQLPQFGGFLGAVLRETALHKDERLVHNLWVLLAGREPKPKERDAAIELMRKSQGPDEKGDALVDLAWAVCQTQDFADLQRSNTILVRGIYKIALDREPTEAETASAVTVLDQARETAERGAAVEGLLTGLLRTGESVFRQAPYVGK